MQTPLDPFVAVGVPVYGASLTLAGILSRLARGVNQPQAAMGIEFL